jgi:hypothetical protein
MRWQVILSTIFNIIILIIFFSTAVIHIIISQAPGRNNNRHRRIIILLLECYRPVISNLCSARFAYSNSLAGLLWNLHLPWIHLNEKPLSTSINCTNSQYYPCLLPRLPWPTTTNNHDNGYHLRFLHNSRVIRSPCIINWRIHQLDSNNINNIIRPLWLSSSSLEPVMKQLVVL